VNRATYPGALRALHDAQVTTGDEGDRDFWIVWSPGGERPPQCRHYSQADAVRKAERLARANPGQRFFALMAVTVSIVPTTMTRRFPLDSHDIPF